MCLIVDANIAAQVFVGPADEDFKPVRDALFDRTHRAVAVHGGQLTREYLRITALSRILRQLDAAGRARVLPTAAVEAATQRLRQSGLCESNDHHVLAVALLGQVRLLCSRDKTLMRDFKDQRLLSKPRGKCYCSAKHLSLLLRACGSTAKISQTRRS